MPIHVHVILHLGRHQPSVGFFHEPKKKIRVLFFLNNMLGWSSVTQFTLNYIL